MNLGLRLSISGAQAVGTPSGVSLSISATSIAEDASPGDSIGTLSASGGVGPYTYAIDTDADAKFAIGGAGSDELVIRTGASLDYETATSHSVTVEVTDTGDGNATYLKAFIITVTNVATTLTPLTASVAENTAQGTTVASFTLTDAPGAGALSLSGPDAGYFQINGLDLERSATALDFDTLPDPDAPYLAVTVSFTDNVGPHSFDLTITVTDVNEAPTIANGGETVTVLPYIDTTAPALSSPVDAANGQTAATGSVDTDEGNGTLYWVVTQSATAPSAAQVKAGQDHTGTAADDDGSQAVSTTGTQTLSPAPSGLTASTAYYLHFMHEDAAGNQSAVASGDGFTTAAAGLSAPVLLGTFATTANGTDFETTSFDTTATSVLYVEVTTTNNDSTSVVMGYTDITIGASGRGFGTGTSISTTPKRSDFATRNNIQVFELLAPAAASGQTVQVRLANTSRSTVIRVWKVEGADRTAQGGATAESSLNGNQASSPLSLTTGSAGSIVFYAGYRNYNAEAITITGATELDQRTSGGTTSSSDHHAWAAWEDAPTAGTYGMTASWTSSLGQAAVAIEVEAA